MFYKLNVESTPYGNNFDRGLGFYLVEYSRNTNPMLDEIWYYNPKTNANLCIEVGDNIDESIRCLFESDVKNEKVVVLEKENTSNISEEFFLKAIALSRMDMSDVELNQILN